MSKLFPCVKFRLANSFSETSKKSMTINTIMHQSLCVLHVFASPYVSNETILMAKFSSPCCSYIIIIGTHRNGQQLLAYVPTANEQFRVSWTSGHVECIRKTNKLTSYIDKQKIVMSTTNECSAIKVYITPTLKCIEMASSGNLRSFTNTETMEHHSC